MTDRNRNEALRWTPPFHAEGFRPVFIETVVLRLEGPELLLARDVVGTPYLCLLVSRDGNGDRFVAVQVSNHRYADVRCGRIDLRTAFTRPELKQHFAGFFARVDNRPAIALKVTGRFSERSLPVPNIFVTDFAEQLGGLTDD